MLVERTERAIEACYDAVLAPGEWPRALQLLAESLGAESCTFFSDDEEVPPKMPISTEHAEFHELWLRNESDAPDPHVTRAPAFRRAGYTTLIEDQISTKEERRTLPYYQEIARPGARDWYASTPFMVDEHRWSMPLYRGARRGRFFPEETNCFAEVGPHLGRIVRLAKRFAAFQQVSELSSLERASCAAILLDEEGRAKDLNVSAQKLIGEEFYLVRGRPATDDPSSNDRVRRLLAGGLPGRRDGAPAAAPVVISRSESPWLLAEVMPLSALGSDLFTAGCAVLLLTDLRSLERPDALRLRAAFGLTAAEARLAARLASGDGINAAAIALGISRETARTQLRAVFAKTNTHRQAELATLVARLRPHA
ncbi:helix-turn-helix transcriptional regulator [Mesorhizobium sp. WSM3224]|uniref:helix-turn-helix transcriptional regulator n=1 Tax=Mesorhizobium sp. WSM3224 TaxID=1040986 RepID=UPI0004827567|nr:helix-turn-helix transcriptional regulator [Mesorhizobium sp. WSM3224]